MAARKTTTKKSAKKPTSARSIKKISVTKKPKQNKEQSRMIIAGNWKMNPETLKEARSLVSHYKKLATSYKKHHYILAVPAVFLYPLTRGVLPKNLSIYDQAIYSKVSGSYTGALSISQMKEVGAQGTLIGHSERRTLFGIDNNEVTTRIDLCISQQFPMIVCFGETQRDPNGNYIDELEKQIQAITDAFSGGQIKHLPLLTLAYEPVWAIGSSAKRAITSDELFSTMILIRNILKKQLGPKGNKVPILYGGSVNADNAGELLDTPDIAGFLLGRASLDKKQSSAISTTVSSKKS